MKGYNYIIVLFWVFALSGCIRDDGSGLDCERTRISFYYYGDVPGQCRFLEKSDNVTLFVYDSDGNLVARRTKSGADLQAHKGVNLNLPDGNYSLVAWTNLTDGTEIHDAEQLSKAVLGSAAYYAGDPIIHHENDRVYFATKKITVVQSQFRDEELLFDQAHIPLHVHVTGAVAPATRATAPIEVDIVNLHPQMGFDGASASALKSVYRAQLAYDAETGDYVARVNAFRFLNDNDIRLKLSNSGGEICYKTVELADFMNEHAISVEDKDEAEIAIRFRFNNTSVEVAPWEEEDIDPIQK